MLAWRMPCGRAHAGVAAELADDAVDPVASQSLAMGPSIEGDEERAWLGSANRQPVGDRRSGRRRQSEQLGFRPPFADAAASTPSLRSDDGLAGLFVQTIPGRFTAGHGPALLRKSFRVSRVTGRTPDRRED